MGSDESECDEFAKALKGENVNGVQSENEDSNDFMKSKNKSKFFKKRYILDDESDDENGQNNLNDLNTGISENENPDKSLQLQEELMEKDLNDSSDVKQKKKSVIYMRDSSDSDSSFQPHTQKESSSDKPESSQGSFGARTEGKVKNRGKVLRRSESSGESDTDFENIQIKVKQLSDENSNSKRKKSLLKKRRPKNKNKSSRESEDSDTTRGETRGKTRTDTDSSSSPSSGESDTNLETCEIKNHEQERVFDEDMDLHYKDFEDNEKNKTAKKGPQRKSKLTALEEIHSETQRLIRESHVSLPYHHPKQRSLTDFLNRRKSISGVSLRTPISEMTKVWELIEEREKEAPKFYRSESEEEEEENTDNCLQNEEISTQEHLSQSQGVEISNKLPANSEMSNSQTKDLEGNNSQNTPNQDSADTNFTLTFSESILKDTIEENNLKPIEIKNIPESETVNDSIENNIISDGFDKNDDSQLKNTPEKSEQTEIIVSPGEMEDKKMKQDSQEQEVETSSFFEISLSKIPKLSGQPDDIIDLDETSSKPGAFGLMRRFLKHVALKPKKKDENNINLSVVSSELNDKGEVVNIKEENVTVKSGETPKPGEKLVVLKASLQQQMALSREQQLAKKLEEYKLNEEECYEGEKEFCDGLPNEEEEELEVNDTESSDSSSSEDEEEKLDGELEDKEEEEEEKRERKYLFADDEAEESEDDEVEETNTQDSETTNKETVTDLLGDDDTNEVDDELLQNEISSMKGLNFKISSLADSQDEGSVDNNLLSLCSGKFTSQPLILTDFEKTQQKISKDDEIDDNLLDLCSGKFTTQSINPLELENSERLSSDLKLSSTEQLTTQSNFENRDKQTNVVDDDSEEEDFVVNLNRSKNRFKKLNFSDDEDEDKKLPEENKLEEEDGESEIETENIELGSDEEADDRIEEDEYEDEETELAKKLSKGFLDGEAELSESDWDSADEDERDLDKLEAEEGDADKINQRKLQKELGKIHMREVLAEDKREIRLLQELLLEDGDLHSDGPKRQRLFRWSNQDNDDFKFTKGDDDENDGNENVDEDEDTWRRERIEREKFLEQKKIDNLNLSVNEMNVNISKNSTSKSTPKIVTSSTSPDPKKKFQLLTNRGSFLKRGDKILSKIAELTTGTKEAPLGNSRGRRMVFAVISPPKTKPEEGEEPKNNNGPKRKGENLNSDIKKKIKFTSEIKANSLSIFEKLKQVE